MAIDMWFGLRSYAVNEYYGIIYKMLAVFPQIIANLIVNKNEQSPMQNQFRTNSSSYVNGGLVISAALQFSSL